MDGEEHVRELVYPAPSTGPKLSRPLAIALLTALVVGYVAVAFLIRAFVGAGLTIFVMPLVVAPIVARLRTVVTAETISVRNLIFERELPVASLAAIRRDGPFRRQVGVRTVQGRTHQLPQVKPRDMAAISALTGLPMDKK